MLVLSRKKGEAVIIGGDIQIVVLSVDGDKVQLGIQAPAQINVYRKEVYEAILKENLAAARLDPVILDDFTKFFKK